MSETAAGSPQGDASPTISAAGEAPSDEPTGSGAQWRTVAAAGGLAVLVLVLVLGEVSASLGRIQVPELPARSMTSVQSTFDVGEATRRAQQAWCLWNGYSKSPVVLTPATADVDSTVGDAGELPASAAAACAAAFTSEQTAAVDGDGTGTWLVLGYVALDAVLIALYVGLSLAFVRCRRRWLTSQEGNSTLDEGLRNATKKLPMWLLFGGLLLSEGVEGVAQALLGRDWGKSSEAVVGVAGAALAFAPVAKFILLAALALFLLLLLVRPYVAETGAGIVVSTDGMAMRKGYFLAVGRLRLQLVTAALLVLLLSGIGQNQVSDALLRWGDLDGGAKGFWLGATTVVLSLSSVGAFSLLLWRSAHRAAFTEDSVVGAPSPFALAAVAAASIALAIWPGWKNAAGLGVALAVIVLLSTFAGAPPWRLREPAADVETPEDATAWSYESAKTSAESRAKALTGGDRDRVARLGRWIAAVPVAAVGISLVRAALPPLLVPATTDKVRLALLVGVGLALLAAAMAVPTRLSKRDDDASALDQSVEHHPLYWSLAGVAAVAFVFAVLPGSREWFPVLVGPVGVVALYFSLLLVVGNEIQRRAEWTVPVAGLRVLGARRNPVLALIVAWFLIGSALDTAGHHDVRIQSGLDESEHAPVADAVTAWLRSNCAVGPESTGDGTPLPMVFVAAQGGGIRAAYWTAAVLDTLFPRGTKVTGDDCEVPASNRVFAASGASGGSVGILSWLNAPDSNQPWYQRPVSSDHRQWYDYALAVDHLSAMASWMLYVDAPRAWVGFPGPDRAEQLERSWESSQPTMGHSFMRAYEESLALAPPDLRLWRPLALVNGTAVESGCRALTAPIQLTELDRGFALTPSACRKVPSTRGDADRTDATGLYDLTEIYLCSDQDLRGSTAALLSARFPYVTPSGRLTQCADDDVHTNVVDGGYLDNSGAMSATDLYRTVRQLIRDHNELFDQCRTACPVAEGEERPVRRIRPVFVQVDNGYGNVAAAGDSGRPRELLVPPRTRLAVAGTVEQTARQRAFATFGSAAFFRIANAPHPGVQAPLGWVMSDSARDQLCDELSTVGDDLTALAQELGLAGTATVPDC